MDSSAMDSSALDSSPVGVTVLVGKCIQGPCSAVPDIQSIRELSEQLPIVHKLACTSVQVIHCAAQYM